MLDVACGTGIVARTAADLVGPGGTVVGVDLNEAMLTVARRVRPDIEWRQGDAAALPFADGVVRRRAVPDGADVLPRPARRAAARWPGSPRPGGTVAVLVPGALEHQAAFARSSTWPPATPGAEAPVAAGHLLRLRRPRRARRSLRVGRAADRPSAAPRSAPTGRPSVDAFVTTEVESTPLVERITADVYDRIRAGAHDVLAPFTTADGSVEAPFEANLVVARRA